MSSNSDFERQQKEKVQEIEEILRTFLPAEEGYQKGIMEAMNYSLMAGGKRLRPMLMQETHRLFGGDSPALAPFMAAMEMIHTYSLVHDDLPAMDNDDYRRGRLTTWRVYGEDMGILAGDALLNYAFETAFQAFDLAPEEASSIGRALQVLARESGDPRDDRRSGRGCGQDRPGGGEGTCWTLIYRLKTGALIEASMMVGAILAGASEEDVKTDRTDRWPVWDWPSRSRTISWM